ncbi:HipA domain-containing protein [Vagococcus sp. PNs007]|uniref:HipA domain-containing protein n=1 Tax=Vagococcus proximus TaxID=2991417 RepID=A0ABT5WYX8_9ENTE|nr:HipA domain-containing protein [Vagococcus proximus]MDF0478958.1 HipA domain-containing protein [Vagococcus proximus]
MVIRDVSDWCIIDEMTTGAREKTWIKSNDNDEVIYLLKYPKTDGEIYAEFLSYVLGTKLFGIEIPETIVAVYDGRKCVLSKDFVGENSEFLEIIDFFGADFDKNNLLEYTIDRALMICKKYNIEALFFKMLFFDYLIGNQDRHCENWGLIYDINISEYRMSPVYDNGSSLLNGYADKRIDQMLTDKQMLEAYINRAKSIFTVNGVKNPEYKILLEYLLEYDYNLFKKTVEELSVSEKDLMTVLNINTYNEISENRYQILSKIILRKSEILHEYVKGGDTK